MKTFPYPDHAPLVIHVEASQNAMSLSTRFPRRLSLPVHAAVVMVGFVLGCGTRQIGKATYPVSGTLLDSARKPATGATVILQPVIPDDRDLARPMATVGEDGSFRLTTYRTGDGAPEGEYVVTVVWPEPRKSPLDPPGRDRLGGKWMIPGPSSPRVTIRPDSGPLLPEIVLPAERAVP